MTPLTDWPVVEYRIAHSINFNALSTIGQINTNLLQMVIAYNAVTIQLGSSGSKIDFRISSADFIQQAKVQFLLRITAYQHKILQNLIFFVGRGSLFGAKVYLAPFLFAKVRLLSQITAYQHKILQNLIESHVVGTDALV